MCEARGADDGMAGCDGEESSAAEALGSVGGVVDIIESFCAVGCVDVVVVVVAAASEDLAARSGNSAGGGYFWKKRRSCGGRDLASFSGFEVLIVNCVGGGQLGLQRRRVVVAGGGDGELL